MTTRRMRKWFWNGACLGGVLLAGSKGFLLAQAPASAPPTASSTQPPVTAPAATPASQSTPPRKPTSGERRRAAKLFLASTKLYEKEQFEEAMHGFEEAARLDPTNPDYTLAVNVAKSHAVTALVQSAAKSRILDNAAAARAALAHALELDPKDVQATEHLHELADDQWRGKPAPIYAQGAGSLGPALELAPSRDKHSFHLRTDTRQVILQAFKAYGLTATIDDSLRSSLIRFDVDDVTFEEAMRSLCLVTSSFYVPLDEHRVLVARNTRENRQKFIREELETVYLPGLTPTELDDVGNMAKNLFEVSQSAVEHTAGTLTIRGPESSLNAFNATMRDLLDGQNQVFLDVHMIQLARNHQRQTGINFPQQMGVFNVYAQAQSILNANQSLVQEIISSGLAAPGDYLTIIGILLASGQVSNSLFSSGIATFGGNNTLTTFGLAPGQGTVTMNINSSDSRELDEIQLRVGDGESATLRSGTRYPITTSSFSSLAGSVPNIPGLNAAGNSGALSSLLSGIGQIANVPMVEYQDLGMTLKATPKVMRAGDVALTLDMKITALAGQSLNNVPVLANRAYSGVATVKEGEGVVLISEIDQQESRAISGTSGISEIPGMDDLTGKNAIKNYATLLIVITPHVVRGTQSAGHTPMIRIERGTQSR